MTELKNDEFADLYHEEMAEGRQFTGDEFVEDCAVESDLEMYFPDNYVPGSSERMLLYRELDNINDDRDLDAYVSDQSLTRERNFCKWFRCDDSANVSDARS